MNKFIALLLSLFNISSSHQMVPFKPFEQCVNIQESIFKQFPPDKQKSVLKKTLNGSQGYFFTHTVEPFSKDQQARKHSFSFNVIQGNGSSNRSIDVAALQADPKNKGALFQVASNLDCLEADGGKSFLVTDYIGYKTQGEIAVLSAAPGIIDRMYLQPDVRLLKDFNWKGSLPLAPGYLRYYPNLENQFKNMTQQAVLKAASTVQVGVQHNVSVVNGFRNYNWTDPRAELVTDKNQKVTQVLTAALDPYNNYKSVNTEGFKNLARILLHAAYKGTFDVARKLGIKKVYLTLVGGGVFKNDYRWISEAITNACNDLSCHPEASGMDITLIIYSKPNVDSAQWGTFCKDIQQLCKKHQGTWRTL